MRIAIIGANGQLGRRLVNEAQARGHAVTACSRARGGVVQVVVDAADTESIAAVAHDHDAVIACTRPPHDADEQTEWVLRTSQGLLDGCAAASTPLLLVGGSGSLKSPNRPGLLAVDDPKIVPDQWRPIARACLAQWELCRNHPWQGWTHACPPAQLAPGSVPETTFVGETRCWSLRTAPRQSVWRTSQSRSLTRWSSHGPPATASPSWPQRRIRHRLRMLLWKKTQV